MSATPTRRLAEIQRLQSTIPQTSDFSLYDLRRTYYGGKVSTNDALRAYLQTQTGLTTIQSLNDLWRAFFIAKGAANKVSLGDMAKDFFTNIGFAATKYSLSFDGSTAFVSTALWSATASNITMATWFAATDLTSQRKSIISNGDGRQSTGGGYALILNGNGTTDGSLYILNHGIAWTNLSHKITDTNWHHIALVLNASGHPTVYLDGSSIYTDSSTTFGTPVIASYVGTDSSTGAVPADHGFFKGLLDDARLYTAALSSSDITNLFTSVEPATSPVNWYKFDEGSGTTATDSGTAAKAGTITAATYSTNVHS